MLQLVTKFANDEAGFIVSAELILVATIAVLSLVVGLTEVAAAINFELDDVACAFGSINQTFCFRGFSGCKGHSVGSLFNDQVDQCDCNSITCNIPPQGEGSNSNPGGGHGGYGRG